MLSLSEIAGLNGFHEGDWGTLTTLYGTLNAAGTEFIIEDSSRNPAVVGAPIKLYLSALQQPPAVFAP